MKFLTLPTLAAMVALSSPAIAAPQVERLRGTIDKVDAGTVTIKTEDGRSETVDTGGARFNWVVKSSLDQIKDGVFIGTATKGENPMTALEVVLFPESMRGTGEGHYGWDAISDHTAGGTKVKSAMTNGTVKAGEAPKVKSAMTNATVSGTSEGAGGRTLTVSYGADGTKTILVPPTAPVVAFEPGDKSIAQPGAKVFSVVTRDGDTLKARVVAVGKDGLTPPM